jgi:predicted ATPase/DNA-binding CsgD family transcriptional regulator
MAVHNLPQHAAPFVGRSVEITEISDRLNDPACRLLTLVGPGGIGKTRLALEIAHRVTAHFADGIYFVPLQPLEDANTIVTAIIEALPLQLTDNDDPHKRLLDYLSRKNLLLVLDNFEHLLNGVDIMIDILNATSQVQLLITSRERLNLRAEHVWPMTGLDIPTDIDDAPNAYSAIQLFTERARRVQPHFSLETQKGNVIRICRLVEGLPLALELAAAWTRVLDCKAIADEVQRSIDILISNQRDLPERHQSIRAVFDHSWRLLTKEERAVLPRLAVFRGGFTLEAAQNVAGASLQILASLVDKSLVQLNSNGRYDLHELLRQYADEELEATGESKNTRDTQSAYYAAFINERVDDLKGRRQIEAVTEINADFENVRTVWVWAAGQRLENIIEQMVDGLWIYCKIRYREAGNITLFRYAEKHFAPNPGEAPRRLWGRLLIRSVVPKGAQRQIEIALDLARSFNDAAEIAFCLGRNGYAAYADREYDKAIKLFEQSLEIYQQLEDHYNTAAVLYDRYVYDHQAAWDYKKNYFDKMLHLRREIGDHWGMGWSLPLGAIHEGRLGNFAEAERLWRERIALGEEWGNVILVAQSQSFISHQVYFTQGNFSQARIAAEEAITLGAKLGETDAVGWGTATLGLLANMNEDYSEGKRLCEQSARVAEFADIEKLAAWGLAVASCGLGDYDAARAHLAIAFNFLTDILGIIGEIAILPAAAIICAHQGHPSYAVELLALALTHPVGATGWMKKWPLLDRLGSDLERTLGSEAFTAAWERGQQRNLSDVITELHEAYFSQSQPSYKHANQSPLDLLSARELEVLALIADGLTNREIADRLFIGVSTVKKHIQHIYTKLDTKNRTSAVLRARELQLLP